MKTCPSCSRSYESEKSFCVYDGQTLIESLEVDPFVEMVIDNKYSIDYKIAEGGTGSVYRATHLQLQSVIAIKIMRQALTNDPVAIERFRREAYAAMKVRHPNAVAVLDFGITQDRLVYVVMELLVGQSLADRLKVRQYLDIQEANHLIQQICAGVAVAHARGIVHRDIKPENIFLHQEDNQEIAKVLDFGIAKMQDFSFTDERASELTGGGAVIGTPFYIAPEQCSGQPVDARADIYSLGVMLYQMLTGQLPFDGPSSIIVLLKQLNEKPVPINKIRPEIPSLINAVVMHALEKDARSRPQTILGFAQELAAATRAVSEQEFQDVFQNATENELEAAILLTSDNNRAGNGEYQRTKSKSETETKGLDPEPDPEPEPELEPLTANLPTLPPAVQARNTRDISGEVKSFKRVVGHLSWFDLATVAYLLSGLQETGLLTLHNAEFPPEQIQEVEAIKPFAWIYFKDGNITHSRLGVRNGSEAFYQLFQMPLEGCFLFQSGKQPAELETVPPIQDTGSNLIKDALGLKTLLGRFALKFPDMMMTFKRRNDQLNWRDPDTEELAQLIWQMLAQPAITLGEILARSSCCNAKTYQVLATFLATRQIHTAKTSNLSPETTRSSRALT